MQFVDYIKVHVKAGDGGRGCVAFRREKYVPRGGPSGGDGGRGGHVIIRANSQMNTLLDLRYHQDYIAEKGEHGMGKRMHGKDGRDLVLPVPVGTIVKNEETGDILADLDADGREVVAVRGGRGGLGNAHFATPTKQAPVYAQPGENGGEAALIIELKLLADAGLIGLPNAGKSTLISVISSARPKIADYPFTTLVPNLGVVKLESFRSFVVADIPGIIEGAHNGTGLGFHFLRHIERTSVLLHLIDISEMSAGDPVDNIIRINKELELYNQSLLRKPQIIVATKLDIADEERLESVRKYCKKKTLKFFEISAATNSGIDNLIKYVSVELESLK